MSERLKQITQVLQSQQQANDQGYKVFAPAAANAMLAKSQDPLFGSAHYLGLLGREERARQQSVDDTAGTQAFLKEILNMDIDADMKMALIKEIAPIAQAGVLNSVIPMKTYNIIDPVGAVVNDGTRIAEREAATRKTEAEAVGELYDAGHLVDEDRVAAGQRGYTEPTTPTDSYNVIPGLDGKSFADENSNITAKASKLRAEAAMKAVNQAPALARIRAANSGGGGGVSYSITEEASPFGGKPIRKVTIRGKGRPPAQQDEGNPYGGLFVE